MAFRCPRSGTAAFDIVGTDLVAARINAGATTERHAFGPGMDEPMVGYDSAGARYYFHSDERGSVVARSDSAGSAAGKTIGYEEYGRPNAFNSRFLFAGKMHIGTVNAYYNNARFYDYNIGRFLQPDPIGYGSGMNLYAYVGGDPVNFTDPSGLIDCPQGQVPVIHWRTERGPGDVVAKYTYVCQPISSFTGGSNAGAVSRGNGGRMVRGRVPERRFTCADAMRESGRIKTQTVSISAVGAIGWVAAKGTWSNMSTGTHGTFTAFGFAAGLAAGASVTAPSYDNISAFTGMSDGFAFGFSIPMGRAGIGVGYVRTWNDSGRGGGLTFEVASPQMPSVAAIGTWTDTRIANCKPSGQ